MKRRDFLAASLYAGLLLAARRAVGQATVPELDEVLKSPDPKLLIERLFSELVYIMAIVSPEPSDDPERDLKARNRVMEVIRSDDAIGRANDPKARVEAVDSLNRVGASSKILAARLSETKLSPETQKRVLFEYVAVSQFLAIVIPNENPFCEIYGLRRILC